VWGGGHSRTSVSRCGETGFTQEGIECEVGSGGENEIGQKMVKRGIGQEAGGGGK
jgi:hypothetical protein